MTEDLLGEIQQQEDESKRIEKSAHHINLNLLI